MVTTDALVAPGHPPVPAEAVQSIVDQVWEGLFSSSAVHVASGDGPTGDVGAHVAVHGEWEGVVSVACPAEVAASMTRRMLGMDDDEALDPLDVEDALREVVNVVGGNVKSLVDGCSLGLPAAGPATHVRQPPLVVVHVDWEGRAVSLAVHDRAQP